jgi:hypothetical protein
VNDREVNLQLLMGDEKLLNEAVNQTLKLEAVNVEAGSAVRLPEVWARRAPKQRGGTTGLHDAYSDSMWVSNFSAENINKALIEAAEPNAGSSLELA